MLSSIFLKVLLFEIIWIFGIQSFPQNPILFQDNQKYEGDLCRFDNGDSGLCTRYDECLEVINYEKYAGIRPKVCGFTGSIAIVCCPQIDLRISDVVISAKKCEEYGKFGIRPTTPNPSKLDPDEVHIQVVGGELTQLGEFPHMAALGWNLPEKNIEFKCGGTLISENFVLTAAHCLTSNSDPPLLVRLTDQSIENKFEIQQSDFRIVETFKHPDYKIGSVYNDIALLRLDRNVEFSIFRRPACLWSNKDINETVATITGWGHIEFAGRNSDNLLKADLSIVKNEDCQNYYPSDSRNPEGINSNQICAGNSMKDACQGDSGGPLQIKIDDGTATKHYVIGITSFGRSCGISPGVYTRVSSYIKWIESLVWK